MELLYSNHPDDKKVKMIPIEVKNLSVKFSKKILRIREDIGFSKKGKTVVLYCESRLFFFQFETSIDFKKFLLFMGYIRNKRDDLPLYIHANAVKIAFKNRRFSTRI